MPRADAASDEQDAGLPEPGSRWGAGAQSVLPYLTKTLQARPALSPESRQAPPVVSGLPEEARAAA